MTLELNDIIFFLKSVRAPSSFDILSFVSFSNSVPDHSSSTNKLKYPLTSTTLSSHFYFNRLPRILNQLPVIEDNLSTNSAIVKVKQYFWSYFLNNFNSDDPCTLHLCCPCHYCHYSSNTPNFNIQC